MKMQPPILCCVLIVWAAFTLTAEAFRVCMGRQGGALAEATNAAIFLMLGVLAVVLSLLTLVGYSLVRKSRLPMPEHALFLNADIETK